MVKQWAVDSRKVGSNPLSLTWRIYGKRLIVWALILALTPIKPVHVEPPIVDYIGDDLVEMFRIDNLVVCGGLFECLAQESDALLMTRVAMAENLASINDRIFILWNIKMRAELGFKQDGYWSGNRELSSRWGPETSVKEEVLCIGGCQYEPVRHANKIKRPCLLPPGDPFREMLCPSDEWIDDFYLTYLIAEQVALADLGEMPVELRGYDSFRSPRITIAGTTNREGGLTSMQFFPSGHIWRDEYVTDNVYWTVRKGIKTLKR